MAMRLIGPDLGASLSGSCTNMSALAAFIAMRLIRPPTGLGISRDGRAVPSDCGALWGRCIAPADAPEERIPAGFARNTVMGVADTLLGMIKAGDVKNLFLIGGCDGARPGRNYFHDLAMATPMGFNSCKTRIVP